MRCVLFVVLLAGLSGCALTPQEVAQLKQQLRAMDQTIEQRSYYPQPVQQPQVNFGTQSMQPSTRTYMINTNQGLMPVRCTELNSHLSHCQ